MHSDRFEEAFSDFLEKSEYDEAENTLFSVVRAAFLAGWNAGEQQRGTGKRIPFQEKEK